MNILKRFVIAAAVSMVAAACGSTAGPVVAGPGALGHIHDLVLTDDDTLLVASHTGLYRIDAIDQAVLVGTEQHDLMAMSVDSGGLLASGHPDLRLDEYLVDDHPPHLGLARSANFGETWTVESDLLGKRDFHAIVPTVDGIFTADAQGSILRRNPDGTWEELGAVAARDLAIRPSNTSQQIAADLDGALWFSADGGNSWDRASDAPAVIEIEWPESGRILGAGENGLIWEAPTTNGPWRQVAETRPELETFHIDGDQWWATLHGGEIITSTDQGETWSHVYEPPQR